MKCKYCGAEIPSPKKICNYCGSEIATDVSKNFRDDVFYNELRSDFNICRNGETKYKIVKRVNNDQLVCVEYWTNKSGKVSSKNFSGDEAQQVLLDAIRNNIPISTKPTDISPSQVDKTTITTSAIFDDNIKDTSTESDKTGKPSVSTNIIALFFLASLFASTVTNIVESFKSFHAPNFVGALLLSLIPLFLVKRTIKTSKLSKAIYIASATMLTIACVLIVASIIYNGFIIAD